MPPPVLPVSQDTTTVQLAPPPALHAVQEPIRLLLALPLVAGHCVSLDFMGLLVQHSRRVLGACRVQLLLIHLQLARLLVHAVVQDLTMAPLVHLPVQHAQQDPTLALVAPQLASSA